MPTAYCRDPFPSSIVASVDLQGTEKNSEAEGLEDPPESVGVDQDEPQRHQDGRGGLPHYGERERE